MAIPGGLRRIAVLLVHGLVAGLSIVAAQPSQPAAVVAGASASAEYGIGLPLPGFRTYRETNVQVWMRWVNAYGVFPELFSENLGLSTTLGFGMQSYHMNGLGPRLLDDGSGGLTTVTQAAEYHGSAPAIQADLLAYVRPSRLLRLELGPWTTYGFEATYAETEEILSPAGAQFSDGSSKRTRSVKDDPDIGIVGVGGLLRVMLECPVGDFSLCPSAYTRIGAVFRADQERGAGMIATIGIGIGFLYGHTGEPSEAPASGAPVARIDTLATPPVRMSPPLAAHVDLYSLDPEGRRSDTFRLIPRRILHRVEIPLLNAIPFDPGSSALPSRFAGYDVVTRDSFTIDMFAELGPEKSREQTLNVIGARMRAGRSMELRITGRSTPREPRRLATERAEAVRRYLVHTWGIGAARIHVTAQPGFAEEPGVQISSGSRGLLDVVQAEWVEEGQEAPPVGLQPQITAGGGVRRWFASVHYGGAVIGTVGHDSPSGAIDAGFMIRNPGTSGGGALIAELFVEDSAGNSAVARDSMLLATARMENRDSDTGVDRTESRYLLADSYGPLLDVSLERIVAAVSDSAVVEILPAGNIKDDAMVDMRLRVIAGQLQALSTAKGKKLHLLDRRGAATSLSHHTVGPREAGALIVEVRVITR